MTDCWRVQGWRNPRWLIRPLLGVSAFVVGLVLPAIGVADVGKQDGQPTAASSWHKIVTGRLANGVRYAILPRTGREPGVGLLMRDQGGFIAEHRPGERGLAHLIEHIALVSPTSGAPGELDHFLHVGLPLSFPAPSAGTTSWAETNYFLSTRTNRPADLATLFGLFKEVATDLTFRADAVDGQRADVMREMAERRPGNLVYARYIAAVAPGSPTDVIDAQNSDDVPTASVATIRGLYHRLYRPENIMLVVVGDVDPAETQRLINQSFGGWRADSPAPTIPPVPTFRADRIAPISYSDAADGRRTAMVTVTSATLPPSPTLREQMDASLMEQLVVWAVNNRLAARFASAPSDKTGFLIENGEQGHRLLILWDDYAGTAWQPAVAGLQTTVCGLNTDGFSDEEWARAKQDLTMTLQHRAAIMSDRPNVELAKDLSHALAAGRMFLPPDELLRRAGQQLPTITAATGSAWWRRQWHAGPEQLRVEAPDLAKVQEPAAAIRTVANGAVAQPGCRVERRLE